jgi:polysaccharide deacetylase family protein (PEP-CTERM system associated)
MYYKKGNKLINNFLTFDIEEWYHANYSDNLVDKYKNKETNLSDSILKMLDMCDKHNVKSTCFILGSVAKEKPQIVKDIFSRGHEVASHSFAHKLVYTMTPNEFKEDLKISCDILEQITGTKVLGFRAPSWSIKQEQLDWFYDILEEQGLIYSSSVYPAHTYLYGISDFPQHAHNPIVNGKQKLILEIPQSVIKVLNKDVGFAGGFYLRFFPEWFVDSMIMHKNKNNQEVFLYLHPREIEPDEESMKIKLKFPENLIHYYGLNSVYNKLSNLTEKHSSSIITMQKFAIEYSKKSENRV